MENNISQNTNPMLITVEQAAKLLNIRRTKMYELINYEGIPAVHFGRAVRVNPIRLQEWLTQWEQNQ
jgi:excisionase family DNA binding protein